MSDTKKAYKSLELLLTIVLLLTTADFIVFLFYSAIGVAWVKTLTAIFAIGVPVLCLIYLMMIHEWLKQRSLWLTTGFACIMVCTIVSLVCHFPGPVA